MGRVLARRKTRLTEAEEVVRPILEIVRTRGDKGLLELARKFDNFEGKSVRVTPAELAASFNRVKSDFRNAVEVSARNVRRYAENVAPAVLPPVNFYLMK